MQISYWLQNAIEPKHLLVDMGSAESQEVRENTDRLTAAIKAAGFKGICCQIVGNGRVTVRIPPKVNAAITAAFTEIVEGAAEYSWCTHGWRSNA